jgi:hypothetical protein
VRMRIVFGAAHDKRTLSLASLTDVTLVALLKLNVRRYTGLAAMMHSDWQPGEIWRVRQFEVPRIGCQENSLARPSKLVPIALTNLSMRPLIRIPYTTRDRRIEALHPKIPFALRLFGLDGTKL